jgi:3-methyl-2-oxobutanoate hydroxymethyltransferase
LGQKMAEKITNSDLLSLKKAKNKISAISCYDYTTARLVSQGSVEMIIGGDSAAQIMLGYDSTLPATMDFMVAITAAVRRGAPNVCLIADMPFMSYQAGIPDAIRNAGRFLIETGCDMVKIEAAAPQLDVIKAVSDADMAVMAHIGIRPQSITKLGKLKAEGTTAQLAVELVSLADKMVTAGASALLLEGTAREVAAIITQRVPVPVISCGSGPDCDGQVLIISDVLGLCPEKGPKFAKNYANLAPEIVNAVKKYSDQVKSADFPDDDHCYHIKPGELEKLQQILG